jgi:hypothetical protein
MLFTNRLLMFLVALTIAAVACRKSATEEIDFGTFSNSQYRNDYLAFSIDLPSGWPVQSQAESAALMKAGTALVAGDKADAKRLTKVVELQTVTLFTVSQHPMGSPVDFNPSIISIAERVSHLPGIKRGKDYHFHSRKLLEQSAMKIESWEELPTAALGGASFDVVKLEFAVAGKSVKQLHYVSIRKGYALAFVLSYSSAEQLSDLQKVLDTIKTTE